MAEWSQHQRSLLGFSDKYIKWQSTKLHSAYAAREPVLDWISQPANGTWNLIHQKSTVCPCSRHCAATSKYHNTHTYIFSKHFTSIISTSKYSVSILKTAGSYCHRALRWKWKAETIELVTTAPSGKSGTAALLYTRECRDMVALDWHCSRRARTPWIMTTFACIYNYMKCKKVSVTCQSSRTDDKVCACFRTVCHRFFLLFAWLCTAGE